MFSVVKIFDKNLIILRDDLLGEINGNKARKLAFLGSVKLPYKNLICYGSSQSNAMQALALYSKNKYTFHFVCERECQITGNLKDALENNANIYYSSKYEQKPRDYALFLARNIPDSFFIEEGVCNDFARFGFYEMAKQIAPICKEFDCDVFLPSGTYTSAIYLEKYMQKFSSDTRVFTCPCVSTDEYFKKQINKLNPSSKLKLLKTKRKYRFAKLYEELYIMHQNIDEIEFDLLYDSVGLATIYENLSTLKKNILYIHQGGLIGSKNMQKRYEEKLKIWCAR